jgi:hypothetical protein
MLSVTNKPFTLSVVMLNVVMLNVIMLSVVMLNVVLPTNLANENTYLSVYSSVETLRIIQHLPCSIKT